MGKQKLCLNGEWKIKGSSADGLKNLELIGLVPGHIHLDLMREGLIQDYFWRDQAEDCQWVEDWEWTYEKEIDIPVDFDLNWAEIEFAGLDTYATILINGEEIATTSNMFIPHYFEVGKKLKTGKNTIMVQFSTVGASTKSMPLEKYSSTFTQDRVFTRRMQCTFSWDWVNRFVSYGIWRSVTLLSYWDAFIKDMFVYTQNLDQSGAVVNLEITCEKRNDRPLTACIEIFNPDQKVVINQRHIIYDSTVCFNIHIPDPELWWPNGFGNQPLYSCNVVLINDKDEELDSKCITFGIRMVHIEQLKDAPGSAEFEKTMEIRKRYPSYDKNGSEPGSSFTLIVNGKRVFCKGGNWVPCDPFPSRIPSEHYDRLIKLARDCNINMLRCWGGGIYEAEAFWNACDRYGIMVTQDFLMACASYPEDNPIFLEQVYNEIFHAVRMLRNHTSLVWWTGDNENGMNGDFDDPLFDGRKIADTISEPLCRQLDPSRLFMPTSPYGGRPNMSMTVGNTHHTAFLVDELTYMYESDMSEFFKRIQNSICRFASETATFGAPPMDSLLTFMTMEDIEANDGAMWYYHTKNHPGLTGFTLYDSLVNAAEKLFGASGVTTLKLMKMEYVQYLWVQRVMETARMNKWYCSGLLFWMYNDCWPASGWSIVDYYGFPKAGYYALKKASKPVIVAVDETEDSYNIWVCSDCTKPIEGELDVSMQDWNGQKRWERKTGFSVCINTSCKVMQIEKHKTGNIADENVMIVCEISGEFGQDRTMHFLDMPYMMKPPFTNLSFKIDGNGQYGQLTISTEKFARVVTIIGNYDFSDNYFDMLPGESRIIDYSVPYGAYSRNGNKEITVRCWNQIAEVLG